MSLDLFLVSCISLFNDVGRVQQRFSGFVSSVLYKSRMTPVESYNGSVDLFLVSCVSLVCRW